MNCPDRKNICTFLPSLLGLALECFLIKRYLLSQVQMTNLLLEIPVTRQPGQMLSLAVSSIKGFSAYIPDVIAYQNRS